jgi:hypothetical protein
MSRHGVLPQLVVSVLSKVMKDYEPGLLEFIESVWQQALPHRTF